LREGGEMGPAVLAGVDVVALEILEEGLRHIMILVNSN